MGYFNGYSNWKEYAEAEGITRRCECCNKEFTPRSPNQKRHSYTDWVEDSELCWLDDEINRMSATKYLQHVGETKQSYIGKFGIDQYKRVVLQTTLKRSRDKNKRV